jgi:DNA modification methylase
MSSHRIIQGDCIEGLRTLPDASVHCCVTSPPYWGLRDYGHDGQIGLESTPEAYVARMVEVFREVRRVLREDGTLWLNLGDSYAANRTYQVTPTKWASLTQGQPAKVPDGLKPKDLVGIPWRVAFALQADGWWLRQDIIWHKPNPMPESVRDRCTKAHEYVFLLTKSERYFYDAEAISEKAKDPTGFKYQGGWAEMQKHVEPELRVRSGNCRTETGSVPHFASGHGDRRNRRSVWTVTTKPYKGAHFATMPPALVEPCILAGCPEGGTVLDPFAGSGTTLAVAAELGRNGIGCELNPEYIELAEQRIAKSREKVALFCA